MQSVEMVEHITAVPNTLPFVEGVTLARGQFIPSINLRIRLGLPRIPLDPKGSNVGGPLKGSHGRNAGG